MARYRLQIEGLVDFETLSPGALRKALVTDDPSMRESIKNVLRAALDRELSGNSKVLEWSLHVDNVVPLDGGPEVDLADGDTEETEPRAIR